MVDAVDYDSAIARILSAARERRPFAATALAVHGVVTGWRDKTQRYRLNRLDLVTPDGQPVRWVLNLIHKAALQERVYGPTLMLRVCSAAALEGLPIYLYGSEPHVVAALARNLESAFPGLAIAGAEPSRFRSLTPGEREALVRRIRESGARVVLVGLGCPRQEVFAYEFRDALSMPVIGVGAAFDYHAGFAKEPPAWMQRSGLQWLHRLLLDPRRLFKRYLVTNTIFVGSILLQLAGFLHPDSNDAVAPETEALYG
jgi:N-acetylglucosaminyldiphosphoundecaprenol N-acetyl-beta-D-mannosaminyltransferase